MATAPLLGACDGLSVAIIGGALFFSHLETEPLQIYQLPVVSDNHPQWWGQARRRIRRDTGRPVG
ncbi:hypothetical protein [Azospirillum sp. Sh1]|uniref:hypothetical protein n=1 Tax=Azospirillum sp. Sh1 TaxID=2607285 RepID=UPI00165DFFE7|nr:hypothetical protein [Azospirillum sp. Sh1]